MIPDRIVKRFWTRVDVKGPDECWPWTAWLNLDGYGIMWDGISRQRGAHVLAFMIGGGVLLPGQKVLHSCDFRACQNFSHLRAGSQTDNVKDMDARGRRGARRGETHGSAKLTDAQADEIAISTLSCSETGKQYGITKSMVSRIRRGLRKKATQK